jgi:hypothetical protein
MAMAIAIPVAPPLSRYESVQRRSAATSAFSRYAQLSVEKSNAL